MENKPVTGNFGDRQLANKIFVTAPKLHADGVKLIEAAHREIVYLKSDAADEIERIMGGEDIEAVISRTAELSEKAILACTGLKVISKHGVGVSNIDVAAATRRGIPVYVTPGANAQSVAEMAMGLLFSAARKIAWMDRELRRGEWARCQDGVELRGKTIGLVGFGQIGQKVAGICLAVGMQVVAYDPVFGTVSPLAGVRMLGSLDELLPLADVLSLHIPLNSRTRGLIGAAQLAALRDRAILINTARGEIVDEPALVDCLRSGKLYAAGLDTMAVEPLPTDSPLLALGNVVLTPHVGGSTPAALAAMASDAARNVLGFLGGNPPPKSFCVNPEVLK